MNIKGVILTTIDRLYYWRYVNRDRKNITNKEINAKKHTLKFKLLSSDQENEYRKYWSDLGVKEKLNLDFINFYYTVSNNFDVRLIPDYLFYLKIDPYYNNPLASKYLEDKNLFDLLFKGVKMPKTVVRKVHGIFMDKDYNIITYDNALSKCKIGKNLIIKPSIESEGGKGIKFYNTNDSETNIETILIHDDNFIIQELLSQCSELLDLHKNSINTIRLITFVFHEKVYLLSGIIRIGNNNNRVDNVSSGGFSCGIKDNGQLKKYAYDYYGIKTEKHPQGAIFKDHKIPNYEKCKTIAMKLATRMLGYSKMISWDFAIDESNDPVLIEANLCYGGLDIHQMSNGPIFGDLTEDVIKESIVYNHK